MSTLQEKSVDGVIWNLIEKFGIQFVKLVLGIILARMLTPADYGLIGMITVFFVIANVFIDSGFGLAYIQKKDANEFDASTIFFFNLFLSLFFYGLLWLVAPLISNFYNQPQLIELIRVMAIILVINSFSVMQIAKLTKDVNFKKKTMLLLSSSVIAGLAGITAALLDFGVWSLVIQGIVNSFIMSLGLWVLYKWRPLLVFRLDSLRSLFSFSSWALLTGIFSTIFNNIYILVIGKFFPASELGFYTKAQQFQKIVSQQPSKAIGSVAFPVFSQLQDDKSKLKNAMRKFNQHTLLLVAPFTVILLIIAKPLFLLLLTEKWLPMVPYFQLLLLAGILYPMHMINVQVLSAQGKVRLTFKIELIKNTFRVINIVIMYKYGVFYIILGEIGLSFMALIINTYYSKLFVNYGLMEQIKDLASIFLISIVLSFSGMVLMNKIPNDYLKIICITIFVVVFYSIGIYYFNRKLFIDNLNIIRNKFFK